MKAKIKNKRSLARIFVGYINGDFLTKKGVAHRMPFLLFATVLLMLYIGNTHYAEKTVRELDGITKELKELRSEHITTLFELMFKSRQSEVAKSVANLGLKESVTPPLKIVLKKNEEN